VGARLGALGRLRGRLALLVAGSSAVALGVLALAVVPSLQSNLEDARLATLRHSATASTVVGVLVSTFDSSEFSRSQVLAGVAQSTNAARVYTWDDPSFPPFASSDTRTRRLPAAPDIVRRAFGIPVTSTGGPYAVKTAMVQFDGQRAALVAYPFATSTGSKYVALYVAPFAGVHDAVSGVIRRMLIGGAVALAIAVLLGVMAAELLARRLFRLRRATEQIARGRFDTPVVDPSSDEIGDLARSFEAMRLRLAWLDRTRSEFIANASHELRTPLTSLAGYLELLDEGDLDAATRAEFVDTMREQVERMAHLAGDLLDLTRLDAGGVEIEAEPVELGEIAAGVVRDAQPLAARRGSVVELEPGADEAAALADELRVQQIARALVDNALRHTPSGSRVRVSVWTGERAILSVADDGPGIPADVLPHVFERFYRGPGAPARGSGLGLAIARELAPRMGGSLTVSSGIEGTTFTLELPAVARALSP
jgi:signal transduction histidine kinase